MTAPPPAWPNTLSDDDIELLIEAQMARKPSAPHLLRPSMAFRATLLSEDDDD